MAEVDNNNIKVKVVPSNNDEKSQGTKTAIPIKTGVKNS